MNPNHKYFSLLGIAPTTDKNVIKKAYRKKAFQYHPDKNESADAQSKFIAITDAYEIVTGIKQSPRTKKINSAEPNATTEERMAAAKARYQKAKQKELEEAVAFYFGLIQGKKWKFIKVFKWVSAGLAFLLVIDFLLPQQSSLMLVDEMFANENFSHLSININNSIYHFNYNQAIAIVQYPLVEVYQTPVFNDLSSIQLLNSQGEKISFQPIYSMLSIFPLIPLLLLLPAFTYYYKRPNALFTILHMASSYIIPLVFVFILLSNWRIFQVFM